LSCRSRASTCGSTARISSAVTREATPSRLSSLPDISAFERLRPEYPDIELELVRIDTFSSAFPRHPHRCRLVATTNLIGAFEPVRPGPGLAGGVTQRGLCRRIPCVGLPSGCITGHHCPAAWRC